MNIVKRLRGAIALVAALLSAPGCLADVITYYPKGLLGSPRVATNSSGQVVWTESYKPHGERLNGQLVANKIWYTSRHQDDDTGLVYMGARYYDPVTGRFMGVDPKRFQGSDIHSFNRYSYANNNPYKYVDPDGRATALAGGLGLLALAGATAYATNSQFRKTTDEIVLEAVRRLQNIFNESKDAPKGGNEQPKGGDSKEVPKPDGIPDNWVEQPTRDADGRQWVY